MKNIIICLLVSLFFFISCSGNTEEQSPLPSEFVTDALKKYEISANPEAGFSINFTIKAPLRCSVKSDQEWCKVRTACNDDIYVTLNFERNQTGLFRTAHVTVSSLEMKGDYVIEVVQEAALLELANLESLYASEGGTYKLYVSSDDPWLLKCDTDWLSFDKTSGDATVASSVVEVKLTVKANDTGISRIANVSLSSVAGNKKVVEVMQNEPWKTEVRIGDRGLRFDNSRVDPVYTKKMTEWQTAGRRGGVPPLEETLSNVTVEFGPETSVEDLKKYFEDHRNQKIIVKLRNGEYDFNKDCSVWIYSNAVLVGESRDGVVIKTGPDAAQCILNMYASKYAGIRNLTIKGEWKTTPPDPSEMENVLSDRVGATAISMQAAYDCFVDNVKITNCASHPLFIKDGSSGEGGHNTIRDLEVDGAYNKGGNCNGYVYVGNSHNLITGCKITHIRHISFQGPLAAYNVFYKNDVTQEVSFHGSDGGDNLIEYNKITIPETLHEGYCAIMGPWSNQHQVGGKNFIYRNKCLELHKGEEKTPWSDSKLYIGPWKVRPVDLYTNFRVTEGYPRPAGRTFYPVILK